MNILKKTWGKIIYGLATIIASVFNIFIYIVESIIMLVNWKGNNITYFNGRILFLMFWSCPIV